MTPSYIKSYVAQTSITHLLIYMFLFHKKKKKHKKDTTRNNKVEEQNLTQKTALTLKCQLLIKQHRTMPKVWRTFSRNCSMYDSYPGPGN